MDEMIEQSENNVEVAEPQEIETQDTSENNSEVADSKPVQDAETNARFAEMRRNKELDEYRNKASQYEQDLELFRTYTGFPSIEEMRQAIQQAQQQQLIQQEAERLGMNPDAYQQYIAPVNNELSTVKQQLEELQRERQIQQIDQEVNSLRSKYEDFNQYEEQVFNTAIEKGYSLEDAYKLVTYEDRIQNVARQKEQEVLAQVTGRDGKQVLASKDQPSNTNFDPANMSLKEINDLSERVKRGERITF